MNANNSTLNEESEKLVQELIRFEPPVCQKGEQHGQLLLVNLDAAALEAGNLQTLCAQCEKDAHSDEKKAGGAPSAGGSGTLKTAKLKDLLIQFCQDSTNENSLTNQELPVDKLNEVKRIDTLVRDAQAAIQHLHAAIADLEDQKRTIFKQYEESTRERQQHVHSALAKIVQTGADSEDAFTRALKDLAQITSFKGTSLAYKRTAHQSNGGGGGGAQAPDYRVVNLERKLGRLRALHLERYAHADDEKLDAAQDDKNRASAGQGPARVIKQSTGEFEQKQTAVVNTMQSPSASGASTAGVGVGVGTGVAQGRIYQEVLVKKKLWMYQPQYVKKETELLIRNQSKRPQITTHNTVAVKRQGMYPPIAPANNLAKNPSQIVSQRSQRGKSLM